MPERQPTKKEIPSLLLDWYDQKARDLPWRRDTQPYFVWVSEIMLQQTRVEAVIDYYHRFLTLFPTIESLAHADEEKLLKAWEGLGYYNRVRNMKKAAALLLEKFNGRVPSDFDEILSLPGIGEYTAGAILSIAYGVAVPAVDGNVLRVYSRVFKSYEDIADPKVLKKVRNEIKTLIPPHRAGDFNQSLMELGATVCLPNGAPLCSSCPLSSICKAKTEHLQQILPVKSAKKERTVENRTVYLILVGDKICIRKRAKKGLLGGMWEFPNEKRGDTKKQLSDWGIAIKKVSSAGKAKHIFTHIEWQMEGVFVTAEDQKLPDGFVLVSLEQLTKEVAMPSAFRHFFHFLM